MDKKEKKEACHELQESLSKYQSALALASAEGNKRAVEAAKRMIRYCETKLKELKTT